MSDRELLDALSVLARRFGLLERGQSLAIVGDPRDEQPTPPPPRLRFDPDYRCPVATAATGGTWSCSRERGHDGPCAAYAVEPLCHAIDGCVHEAGHAGDHETARGCGAWEWGTNGHKAGCMLRAGHGGPHRGLDADGVSIFTWPCPCYPDCSGHKAAAQAANPTTPGA